jgi:predicted metal-dependent hydrolase
VKDRPQTADGYVHIDSIIRSRRSSFTIQINDRGKVVVRAPLTASDTDIHSLVARKRSWIESKLQLVEQRRRHMKDRTFREGDRYLYLGKYYPLRIQREPARGPKLRLIEGCFLLNSHERHRARELMIAWYRQRAKTRLIKLVDRYTRASGLTYNRVRITGAQKRWGSCTSTGNLNFSYRIIMAPEEVICYVVVHEIAHLREANHSHRFWNLVEEIMPEYRKYRSWLAEKGYRLYI